ncbi:MAG TPA: histidine phosphatase family protein [Acidimicrobiales bacterium]|nr:histidine phosphatase family protein [Acidimicrobiales bacterium]
MQLIIVRHGETQWTQSHQYTGRTDLALTDLGRRQSTAIGPLLKSLLQTRTPSVYSSPLKRTIETMDLALSVDHQNIEPLLTEYDYGSYEGQTFEQITALRPGWDIWRDGCPDGETTDEVASRADRFLSEHVDTAITPVVVFTHGHFSRILTARALGLSGSSGSLFASSVASVSIVQEHHDIRCIGLWNASADLVEAGVEGFGGP